MGDYPSANMHAIFFSCFVLIFECYLNFIPFDALAKKLLIFFNENFWFDVISIYISTQLHMFHGYFSGVRCYCGRGVITCGPMQKLVTELLFLHHSRNTMV